MIEQEPERAEELPLTEEQDAALDAACDRRAAAATAARNAGKSEEQLAAETEARRARARARATARAEPITEWRDAALSQWEESKHHRGQPGNAGQFGTGGAAPQAPAQAAQPQPAPRLPGEADKAYAKRVIDGLQVGKLPEDHAKYFNMAKSEAIVPIPKIIPIEELESSKSDEENKQGGANAPARMWAASQGLLSKRDPITVRKIEGGKYQVVDGNGTFTAAKGMGWQTLPVQFENVGEAIAEEPATKPPPGGYLPDVHADANGDGVADAARVGVPGMSAPPPPPIPRLPNLTHRERRAEHSFASDFETNPEKMAADFLAIALKDAKPGEAPTFGTDDAKQLHDAWIEPDQKQRAHNRATLNTPLHQTANAICKRAFLKHLDTLKEGDEILVTCGACGAGKGYALKAVPKALAMKKQAKAIWDSAGDQANTENPWIQAEAQKRGLKVNYLYIHADPKIHWAHPEIGIIARAGNPADGRMVGAKVAADSYANGARNMQAFINKHHGQNPHASFTILQNGPKPVEIPAIPAEALKINAGELAKFMEDAVVKSGAPPHVQRGALMDARIWKD